MLNKIFIIGFLFCTGIPGAAQDLESMTCLGYQGRTPVFVYYHDGYRDLYLFDEGNRSFSLLEKNKVQPNYKDFFVGYGHIEGSFRRYSIPNPKKDVYSFAFEWHGEFKVIQVPFFPKGTGYDLKNRIVYLGNEDRNTNLHVALPIHRLDLETEALEVLPIKGRGPVVAGGYLFYLDYPFPDQFDMVFDIYRVKIGDWLHPEKIFDDTFMDYLVVGPNGKYLLAEMIEYGYSPQRVLYSVEEKRYLPIPQALQDLAVFYSKNKETFCFYDSDIYGEEKRRFVYMDIPDTFPYLPSWAMDFGDTFITHYLLEDAPEDELKALSKAQLRLLRNALFARKGWRFKSDDLTAFFNRFTWYKEQVARVADNDEVKLNALDKYRAQLMLKIEKDK